jgi:hypothetical protein
MLALRLPAVLEQRVYNRRRCGAAKDKKTAHRQQNEDYRRQPPFLVVQKEIQEFTHESGLRAIGQPRKVVDLIVR